MQEFFLNAPTPQQNFHCFLLVRHFQYRSYSSHPAPSFFHPVRFLSFFTPRHSRFFCVNLPPFLLSLNGIRWKFPNFPLFAAVSFRGKCLPPLSVLIVYLLVSILPALTNFSFISAFPRACLFSMTPLLVTFQSLTGFPNRLLPPPKSTPLA